MGIEKVNKPKIRVDYIKICETFGIKPDQEYFNIYSIGNALWKAYEMGQKNPPTVEADSTLTLNIKEATWSNFIVESAVKEVADFWFNMSPDEPMDGDETERIGKLFLRTLNERMGNK